MLLGMLGVGLDDVMAGCQLILRWRIHLIEVLRGVVDTLFYTSEIALSSENGYTF